VVLLPVPETADWHEHRTRTDKEPQVTTPRTNGPGLGELVAAMPFAERLGVRLEEATPETVTGTLAWAPELCTAGGALHGGALVSLADSVGAVCAFLNLPDGATTSTIETKTNLFRAARSGTLRATARPLYVGRSHIVVQTDLTDDEERRIAQTTQTQAVLRPAG
jgi:1,4-dihydroxy-2-naphthoyl-CoA hydrolase